MGEYFSGFSASGLRGIFVVMMLLPVAIFRNQLEPIRFKENWKKILLMTLISTLIWGLLYYSFLHAGVGVSATVNYAAITIGMVLFGNLILKEKISKNVIISLLLGLVGLALIFINSFVGSVAIIPLTGAIVSGLAISANTIIAKQLPYNPTQTTIVMWATSIFANFPMMLLLNESIPTLEFTAEWFYLILFSICSILSTWTLMSGLKYIEANIAGIIGLLEIVFGIFFGMVLFGEILDPLVGIGALVIILAAGYPYIRQINRNTGKESG